MEEKLLHMKQLADQASQGNLTVIEIQKLNTKLNNLAAQINALDEENRKTKYEGINE